jgi:rRNA small subunit pseudouridine methyltransferase Nep1
MTRAYSVKGKKRKNKDVVEEEEDEEQVQPNLQNQEPTPIIITEQGNNNGLVGIPIAPPTEENSEKPGVIFILEKASLEVAKVGKVLPFSALFLLLYGFRSCLNSID